jgi:hypothetical protein
MLPRMFIFVIVDMATSASDCHSRALIKTCSPPPGLKQSPRMACLVIVETSSQLSLPAEWQQARSVFSGVPD